jgi:hypothetical protein
VSHVLYDETSRRAAVRDRADALRRDFDAGGRPRSARLAIGERLVRLGIRLAGEDPGWAAHSAWQAAPRALTPAAPRCRR